MRCPYCKQDDDRVIDSRAAEDGLSIRRRRECNHCAKRFTSYERIEELPLYVIKKSGSRELYNREKVMTGIKIACRKRSISVEKKEALVDRVETEMLEKYEKEVNSEAIGALVIKELRKVDQVAYVRFASVYKEFKDVNEFVEELKGLLK
jgi:transcriptional repressor NrdR